MNIDVRPVTQSEHRYTEEISRKAFWNIYSPGADAHCLLHKIRTHSDFIPNLDYVATIDGKVVGTIVYTKSFLIDGQNERIATATFGPISVLPEFQRHGVGSVLIDTTCAIAREMGFKAIVIYGNPTNYTKFGFCGSKNYRVANPEGKYPCALLVKMLEDGTLPDRTWKFYESSAFQITDDEAEQFDQDFEPMEKGYHHRQEEFWILSRAFVE